MKIIFVFLILTAATQASVDWSKVQPIYRTLPRISQNEAKNNEKIIGGAVAREGQFPYQIGLHIDGTSFCGGSLITESTILTAAHCVVNSTSIEVHAGVLNLTQDDRVIVTTSNYLVHEEFNPIAINNNIALVFLSQSIIGTSIDVVRLPSRSQIEETFAGKAGRVSGWGSSSANDNATNSQLLYTDTGILEKINCEKDYGFVITDCHICTSSGDGQLGVCTNDLGGPVTVSETDGIRTQVAVGSFISAYGCTSQFAHVHSRLTCYLDWIEQNTQIIIRP